MSNDVATATDRFESHVSKMIATAKRSEWRKDIFDDARRLRDEDGFAGDVALAMSIEYWTR
jgi:hypothetical protein